MSIASLAGFVAAVSVLVVAAPLPAAAAPQSPGQVACIASLSKNAAKATKLHVKEASSCVKAVAAGKLGGCASAGDCVLADRKGKQAKTAAKLRDAERAACSGAEPEFGRRPGNLVLASVRGETLGLVDDLLGADLDAALLTKSVDAKGASCQGKVLGASSKMLLAMGAAYETCKMAGLASGSIEDAAGLGDCLGSIDADVKGKIGKAAAKVAKTVAGTCKSTDLAAAFPGSCAAAPDFAECVETRTRCRACRRGPIGDDVDADCDLFDDGATNGSCTGFAGRCHGRAELCDRAYDEVAHPTTHNAFTNAEENWSNPNQRFGMTRQMSDGVRGLMLDTYFYLGEVVMCHGLCNLGEAQGMTPREPLVDGLARIREYLEVDPGAVISIIFESYISEAQAEQAFVDAGLIDVLHAQNPMDPWPTLGELIESGKRLVVFTDDSGASLPWHHYVWDHAWETPYSFSNTSQFTCSINRGVPGNPLYILNHFLTQTFGSLQLANQANRDPLFVNRALQCEMEAGQIPNFVTVDFHDVGSLFSTTDTLNGFAGCTN